MRTAPRRALVVGSGPNGLTAAITLARAGIPVTVLEAESSFGGGARSAALTLPGFLHDVASAVHPLSLTSPAFRSFPLAQHGLEFIQPALALAHPLDDGSAVRLDRSVETTSLQLGPDGALYRRILKPLAEQWLALSADILAPLGWPSHPLIFGRFGLLAPWPAESLARRMFRTTAARALFAGLAAHSALPLERPATAAFGWVLAIAAHAVGWPIPRGGSQSIADALVSYLRSLGGTLQADHPVRFLDDLDPDALVMLDLTPRQFLSLAGPRLPAKYRRKLERYRYGPGAFKVDWALSDPIPWTAPECRHAGTIHVGGTLPEIAAAERAPWQGTESPHPFVLLAQPSLFDPSRAPAGKHTVWAYCHVPNGSSADRLGPIEAQIERFAPGFRETVLARSVSTPAALECGNANLVGGDINGGAQDLPQLFLRPTRSLYRTPLERVYLCSSSTPPGGGVHGMCGYHAARMALNDFGFD